MFQLHHIEARAGGDANIYLAIIKVCVCGHYY